MNNKQLVSLVSGGVTFITAHELSPKEGYVIFKFKKTVKALYTKYLNDESAILQECGITNAKAFNTRLNEISSNPNRTEDEQKEYEQMLEQSNNYNNLRGELLLENVVLEGIEPLNYTSWFRLQNENKAVNYRGRELDVLSGEIEEALEGILWTCPE